MLTVYALSPDSHDRAARQRRFRFVREDGSWAIRVAALETLEDPVSLRQWVGLVIRHMRQPNPSAEARTASKTAAVVEDFPEADGTDAAHPAWWRAHEHTVSVLCQKVHEVLDGKDDGRGFANDPWEALRRRLLAIARRPPCT